MNPIQKWLDNQAFKRYLKATRGDKTLAEVFEEIKHLPKAPINRRHFPKPGEEE